jgi:hypothetical protein
MIEVEHRLARIIIGIRLAKAVGMSRDNDRAGKELDEVVAAMFDGDFIAALRRARVIARQLRDTVGPDHPEYTRLDAMTRGRAKT